MDRQVPHRDRRGPSDCPQRRHQDGRTRPQEGAQGDRGGQGADPQTALNVIDRAVQAFGGAGVSQDTPLANMWAGIRTLRLADGPDEVHLQQMGKNENKRGKEATETILRQKAKSEELFKKYGVTAAQPGSNIKHSKL
uniref:Acyl-CoA dehydrogenase/oxidase C-terminal domain-containing protein n=1 Tax=Bionectria ochroleuca TaxID=29856 RepID=A0A8H7K8I2_BIOOC